MSRFGLRDEEIKQIKKVFSKFPAIKQAIIYGSRAKGTFKKGSDIDIVLVGEKLDLDTLLNIRMELDDLNLPYQIDISIYHKIENPELLEHIRRVGRVLYEGENQ